MKKPLNKAILRQLAWNKNLVHIQKWTILSKTDHLRFDILMEEVPFSSDSEFLRVLVNIGLNQIEEYLIENDKDYYDKFVKNLDKEYRLDFKKSREGYISFDEMFHPILKKVFKEEKVVETNKKIESKFYKDTVKTHGKKYADFIFGDPEDD